MPAINEELSDPRHQRNGRQISQKNYRTCIDHGQICPIRAAFVNSVEARYRPAPAVESVAVLPSGMDVEARLRR